MISNEGAKVAYFTEYTRRMGVINIRKPRLYKKSSRWVPAAFWWGIFCRLLEVVYVCHLTGHDYTFFFTTYGIILICLIFREGISYHLVGRLIVTA